MKRETDCLGNLEGRRVDQSGKMHKTEGLGGHVMTLGTHHAVRGLCRNMDSVCSVPGILVPRPLREGV